MKYCVLLLNGYLIICTNDWSLEFNYIVCYDVFPGKTLKLSQNLWRKVVIGEICRWQSNSSSFLTDPTFLCYWFCRSHMKTLTETRMHSRFSDASCIYTPWGNILKEIGKFWSTICNGGLLKIYLKTRMHSSRMSTDRLFTVCLLGGGCIHAAAGVHPGGCIQRGASRGASGGCTYANEFNTNPLIGCSQCPYCS